MVTFFPSPNGSGIVPRIFWPGFLGSRPKFNDIETVSSNFAGTPRVRTSVTAAVMGIGGAFVRSLRVLVAVDIIGLEAERDRAVNMEFLVLYILMESAKGDK